MTALLIHARVDAQRTDPSDNSNGWIACAVIQAGAQSVAQPSQPAAQPVAQPTQLPNTGDTDTPWLALVALGLFLIGVGALAVRGRSARGK